LHLRRKKQISHTITEFLTPFLCFHKSLPILGVIIFNLAVADPSNRCQGGLLGRRLEKTDRSPYPSFQQVDDFIFATPSISFLDSV
jgi:hypothetical protein